MTRILMSGEGPLKSEAAVRAAGKLGIEGKDYEVRDGDVVHFRFNV